MKWEEIEYFLQKYAPFWDVLDVGCGNGRLFWELKNQKPHLASPYKWEEKLSSSYLWIDASEKLLEEAKSIHWNFFQLLDMRKLCRFSNDSFDNIFFIASFHHLEKIEERIQVLQNIKNLLKSWGKVFFTNWALESSINFEKYSQSKISWSENEFWGTDFQIKIGDFQRYYHSFTLRELEYLSREAWFEVIENRLFETEKNFITILKSF